MTINLNKKINLTKKPAINLRKKDYFTGEQWENIKIRLNLIKSN